MVRPFDKLRSGFARHDAGGDAHWVNGYDSQSERIRMPNITLFEQKTDSVRLERSGPEAILRRRGCGGYPYR